MNEAGYNNVVAKSALAQFDILEIVGEDNFTSSFI